MSLLNSENNNCILNYFNENHFFKNFFVNSPYSMWISNNNGVMIKVNDSFKKMWNTNESEVIEKYCLFTDKLLSQMGITDKLKEVFEKGKTVHFFLVKYDPAKLGNVDMPYSSARMIDVAVNPIYTGDNIISGALIQHFDLTNNFDFLFENSIDAIIHTDKNGIITNANNAAEILFGWKKSELIGSDFSIIYAPEKSYKYVKKFKEWLENNKSEYNEVEIITKNRKIKYCELSPIAVNINENVIIQMIFKDITKRKQDEKEFKELASLNSQIIENAQDGIIVYDLNLKYIIWNSFMEKLSGKKKEEVIGKYPHEVFPFLKEEGVIDLLNSILAGGQPDLIEFSITPHGANKIDWVWDLSSPLKNEKGEIIGILGIVRKITEYKIIQEQLIHSEKLSAVGHLAAGIAHEFNNILAIAQGYTQLLIKTSEKVLPEKQLNSIKTIEKVIKRGKNIVSQMMEFSKPKSPQKESANIADILERIIEFHKNIFESEHITIEKKYNTSKMILIDIGQMEQVFLNIIINARHALIPKNGGCIKLEISEKNNHIDVIISDNGIGMNEETKKKLFTPFFTTKGAYSQNNYGINGTGLGLSVTYMIIQNHGGKIFVSSEENIGTSFTISLPLEKSTPSIINKNGVEKYTNDLQEKSLKILLIDDETHIIEIVRQILEMNNCEVIISTNGKESIEYFKNNNFDAVFLDILLPDMNGIDVLKKMKKINNKINFIFLSGKPNLEVEELKKLGAFAVIEKPFEYTEISQVISNIKIKQQTNLFDSQAN
ncbi:PAS domain S-box protein [Candidatus Dependentiae bacterium]|nr:PAS domain S-box protein [Candidatus Dependentiae bacterium]